MTGTPVTIRVRGIKRYRHPKTGIEYCYHRASGGTPIKAQFGTPEFLKEVEALDAATLVAAAIPGSLGMLIDRYRQSPDWTGLKAQTRESYARVLHVLEPLRDMPLLRITRPFLFELRDKKIFPKRGRWLANYTVTVLSILLLFAKDRGWIKDNPLAERVKKIRNTSETAANRPWSEKERRTVMDRAPAHLRLPLALAMCAGFRKGDFLTISRAALKDGGITVRTSKRGVQVKLPLHPILMQAIAQRPKSDAIQIAVNSLGKPWSTTGFNASWRTFKRGLEADGLIEPGLTPHGLRHTLGTLLREAGADDRTIADVLGQKSTAMARHYSENAELPAKAKQMVKGLNHVGTPKRGARAANKP